ncbi:unnamed protein product [Echinostoma caproni]|uniref:Uncharacterized protein n=1 Tax=Echinostoma caproni TaxID=27848 RepID=A0A3P8I347_9TREM|nr:unnamed protein product [Echinostoma caproni]
MFIRDELRGAFGLWNYLSRGQKRQKLLSILRRLRRRGLLDLLQIRKTFGSLDHLLIPRHLLLEAADKPLEPGSRLTVCGRARDKHLARDSTGRWGTAAGDDRSKNEAARRMMEEILDLAEWINIHHLPQCTPTLEIRDRDGFGLRFDIEPLRFRGFLEPYTKDGWLTRFKH